MNQNTSPTPQKVFRVDALQVFVFNSADDLAKAASSSAAAVLGKAISDRGSARAILASATSQIKFLECLSEIPGIHWDAISLFHMDEYLGIASDHPASFRRFMRERVQERFKPGVFNYIEGDAMEPLTECERYARLLRVGPVDLCCLGIGENGHVAFNDPAVACFHDSRDVKLVKLDLKCRMQQVGEGCFPHLPAVPQYAFTLAIPMLCSALKMICVVPEKRKAQAVKDALTGPIDPACPASVLRQQSHASLFLDLDSASLL